MCGAQTLELLRSPMARPVSLPHWIHALSKQEFMPDNVSCGQLQMLASMNAR